MKSISVALGPKFPLGNVYITPGAHEALQAASQSFEVMLYRHQSGDWGDLGDEDKLSNEQALYEDTRILSAYHTAKGTKLWVITEADRSSTTILLPDEY